MKKSTIAMKIISFLICLVLVFGLTGGIGLAGDNVPPADPTGSALENINEVIDFLDEMDMGDMAENIRQWLKDKKIKIDHDLKPPGSTTPKGIILLNRKFAPPLPEDELERFERIVDLAAVLCHEKTHAHQAPAGGALSDGVKIGDWIASSDVMKECVGPDPLEVEAYYKQIRALLKWWQKINAEAIPGSLSEEEAEAAESKKDDKKTLIMIQFEHAMRLLKTKNYEKASKFDDLDYLMDLFNAILDTDGLSEEEIMQQTIDLLDSLIGKLFDEDSFYDKCRKLYAQKKGEKKTSMAIPAEPGSTTEYVIDLPGGNGYLSIAGLPVDLDVGESETLDITVTEFMIPPDSDAGYMIISPVYEISWNSYLPVPFDITIYIEGVSCPEIMIKAFALTKTKEESSWTDLETEIIGESDFNMLTASSDTATMFAVVAPVISFIDMPPAHWAYDSTARLDKAGVLNEGAILYSNMEVPRELFIEYLVKSLNLELVTEAVPFTDVDEESPFFPYISTAYHNELTAGVAVDRFGMGEIIPREQSITFLIRAIGMEDEALAMPYDDMIEHIDSFFDIYTDCSEWAHPYLAQAVKTLIVEGYPDGSMRGKNLLSHAEVIALIDRIMIHIMYNGN